MLNAPPKFETERLAPHLERSSKQEWAGRDSVVATNLESGPRTSIESREPSHSGLRRGPEAPSRDRAASSRLTLSDDNFNPLASSGHVRLETMFNSVPAAFRPPRVPQTPRSPLRLLPKSPRTSRSRPTAGHGSATTQRPCSSPQETAVRRPGCGGPRCRSSLPAERQVGIKSRRKSDSGRSSPAPAMRRLPALPSRRRGSRGPLAEFQRVRVFDPPPRPLRANIRETLRSLRLV